MRISTWWSGFVCWLARHELQAAATQMDEIRAEVYRLGVDHALIVQMTRCQAYAEGQIAGRREMYDHLERIVAARTHGNGDFVSEEDLQKAKRGLLH